MIRPNTDNMIIQCYKCNTVIRNPITKMIQAHPIYWDLCRDCQDKKTRIVPPVVTKGQGGSRA